MCLLERRCVSSELSQKRSLFRDAAIDPGIGHPDQFAHRNVMQRSSLRFENHFGSEGVGFQAVQIPLHGAICACPVTETRRCCHDELSRFCNIVFHQSFPGRSRFGASTASPEQQNPTERSLQNAMIVPHCHNAAQPVLSAQLVMHNLPFTGAIKHSVRLTMTSIRCVVRISIDHCVHLRMREAGYLQRERLVLRDSSSQMRRIRRLLVIRPLRCVAVALFCGLGLSLAVNQTLAAQDETALRAIPTTPQQSDEGKTQTAATPVATNPGQDVAKLEDANTDVVELLTEDLATHWKQFSSLPAVADAPVWKIIRGEDGKEFVLVCSGEPKGYLHTTEPYADFEMTLEWKYPRDNDGNSGVLVYTQLEPRIWPTSMQIQLHQPKAGSVFPSGDAISNQSSEAEPELVRPVNTWNECKIVSRSGRLAVEVNGKKAGEVSGAKPFTGRIALQSEGSVVHFRRIRIRRLAPEKIDDETKSATPKPATTENSTSAASGS